MFTDSIFYAKTLKFSVGDSLVARSQKGFLSNPFLCLHCAEIVCDINTFNRKLLNHLTIPAQWIMKEKLILAVSGSSVIYDLTTKKDKSVTKQHEAFWEVLWKWGHGRPNGYKTRLQNFSFNGNRHTVARVSCSGYFATFKTDFSVMSVFFIDYRLQFEG